MTLDTVWTAFDEGATAEEIVQQYPSLSLADGYEAIGYCLRNPGRLTAYLSKPKREDPRPASRTAIHFWQVQGFGGSSGPDGLLCGDFLHGFKLIFDYLNQKTILEPNAHYRD